MIDPRGEIRARYDKIHLFDVDLPTGESWRECNVYRHGSEAVVVNGTPVGKLGLTICYDLRFPALFARLAEADADVIAVPAAFTVPTGKAHWHVLLRARAIEAGLFVVAAAQSGIMRTVATPTAIRWSSIPGARCCSTWAKGTGVASPISISAGSPTCAAAFPRSAIAGRSRRRSRYDRLRPPMRATAARSFEGWFRSSADFDEQTRARPGPMPVLPVGERREGADGAARRRRDGTASWRRRCWPSWHRSRPKCCRFALGRRPISRHGARDAPRRDRAAAGPRQGDAEQRESLVDEGVPSLPLAAAGRAAQPSQLIKPVRMPIRGGGRLRSSAG